MSGRGGVVNLTWDGIVPLQSQSKPSILKLDSNLNWIDANEPLHRDIDFKTTCGVGPGMSFSNWVLHKHSSIGTIGLVPCAIGGTKIIEWRRGSEFYNQMIRRAEAAVRGGGKILALLWYQGESDTVDLENAKLYGSRLERLFQDVRADLFLPSLPIIQVAIASGKGPHIEMIRQAQQELNLENVKCIDAMGLPLEPDHLHLTTPAQVQLGHMLAHTFLQSLPVPSPITSSAPHNTKHFCFIFLLVVYLFIAMDMIGYTTLRYVET